MLTLQLLKQYAEGEGIYQYQSKDQLGQFYAKLIKVIGEWEKSEKKFAGTPKIVQDESLALARAFKETHSFKKEKQQSKAYMILLSTWAIETIEAYFNKRMREMGVDDANILTTVSTMNNEGEAILDTVPVFSCDQNTGDIKILVTRVDGEYITYEVPAKLEGEFKTKNYYITRYVVPSGDMKYGIPKDAGVFPFFPEAIKQAYLQGLTIKTLFITEGAFKADKSTREGIPTVGLSSYTHYRDKTSTKQNPRLHKDILLLIERCNVQNVVVCWDGDCRNISIKALELEQDLSQRPFAFFNSAKKIGELLQKEAFAKGMKIFYATIRTNMIAGAPKGLDDLLMLPGLNKENVVKSAFSLGDRENPFFYFNNITNSTESLYEWFGLDEAKNFRGISHDVIEGKEFNFKGDRYRYNENTNEVVLLQPKFLKDLRWIGDNFFELKEVPVPSKEKNGVIKTTKTLQQIMKGTLKDLYGTDFMKFMKNRHYTGFCNMPSHTDYQHEIETSNGRFFNKYFPFEHEPKQGNCSTILDFVKHIFGVQYEMGLDYIQLLLTIPTQKLPVLCLYSPENATGKSKFGELIAQIFKNNVVFINNDDLKSEFGLDRFADKLVAVCEETLLERKKDVERIKFISTAEEPLTINPKGMSAYQLHTYVKLMFFSNNLRMIYASEQDERFWIVRVQKPKVSDADLMEKMIVEIPSFIHYLNNRTLSTKKESRMWFHPDSIRTETLEQVVRVNEHADVQELRNKVEDYFIDFPNESALMLSTKDIIEEFLNGKQRPWVDELCTRLGLERYSQNGKTVVKRSYIMKKEQSFAGAKDEYTDKKINKASSRVWVFLRSEFLVGDVVYEGESNLTQEVIDSINEETPF